jgi:hypothetical protein
MEHLNVADYVVIGEFGIAFFALLTWVVTYAVLTRGNWRRTPEGRHLMAFRSSLVAFMAMGALNNVVLHYPGRDFVRIAVIGAFALSVMDGLRVLVLAQRQPDSVQQLAGKVPEEDGPGKHAARDVGRA